MRTMDEVVNETNSLIAAINDEWATPDRRIEIRDLKITSILEITTTLKVQYLKSQPPADKYYDAIKAIEQIARLTGEETPIK